MRAVERLGSLTGREATEAAVAEDLAALAEAASADPLVPAPAPVPVAWLVAERRGGVWLLGEDWTEACDTLAEAQAVAAQWRESQVRYGRRPEDVTVLAVTVAWDGDPS